MGEKVYQLSIVGFGARGLHALELFYSSLSRKRNNIQSQTIIFETRKNLGTGLAWDPDQTSANCSNIADRAMDTLHGRQEFTVNNVIVPAFPSYLEWLDEVMEVQVDNEKDSYSPRKVTGAYLAQRARSILEPLQIIRMVELCKERITNIQQSGNQFTLTSMAGKKYSCENVLLALGHLPTRMSNLNKKCLEHAQQSGIRFSNTPCTATAQEIYHDSKTILIKGLGLSMIDVVRMIVKNRGGAFAQESNSIFLKFMGTTDVQIVPYSLDGLAMVPKPIGKRVDDNFNPINAGKAEMLARLKDDIAANKIKTVEDILYPIARIVMKIYKGFEKTYSGQSIEAETGAALVVEWFKNPLTKSDHIMDTSMPIVEYMKLTCKMSHGQIAFSLDYTAGQVWREMQIDMYHLFTYGLLPDLLVAEFIQINEQVKRYSFGPPVATILQLIALQEAGVLNLDFHHDPKIKLSENGYEISNLSQSILCDAMVDSVLPRPNMREITDDLMKSILEKPLAEQFAKHLGIRVSDRAQHLLNSCPVAGLYTIGRNAKGSIYGVDSILECFNSDRMQPVMDDIINRL
ncbi:FAD/NAD(P)-binding protein [Nonlabens marinus]|uniref:FAD-dependent urate hydroxylase HpyO/Asp monooxygenase CreE-like FAD/NAD(P)-binding domain-containing protein n=1 Tax=Nonlabens marinus S1-08 TaxID=1454201 RepID=W8VXI5_9FLAO|nr:FAD/NAD(P)-binding protein [Nonlabens marinus]BAO55987.1 hypothetical protein NMS_1978 [Nonlabens marinus S1-08]